MLFENDVCYFVKLRKKEVNFSVLSSNFDQLWAWQCPHRQNKRCTWELISWYSICCEGDGWWWKWSGIKMESLLHSNHSQPDRQVAQKLAFNVKDRESCFSLWIIRNQPLKLKTIMVSLIHPQSRDTAIKMLCLSGFSQYLSEKGLIQFDYKAAFQNKT